MTYFGGEVHPLASGAELLRHLNSPNMWLCAPTPSTSRRPAQARRPLHHPSAPFSSGGLGLWFRWLRQEASLQPQHGRSDCMPPWWRARPGSQTHEFGLGNEASALDWFRRKNRTRIVLVIESLIDIYGASACSAFRNLGI